LKGNRWKLCNLPSWSKTGFTVKRSWEFLRFSHESFLIMLCQNLSNNYFLFSLNTHKPGYRFFSQQSVSVWTGFLNLRWIFLLNLSHKVASEKTFSLKIAILVDETNWSSRPKTIFVTPHIKCQFSTKSQLMTSHIVFHHSHIHFKSVTLLFLSNTQLIKYHVKRPLPTISRHSWLHTSLTPIFHQKCDFPLLVKQTNVIGRKHFRDVRRWTLFFYQLKTRDVTHH
jgi:hypothetical protein